MAAELSYIKAGYKSDKWKWVLSLQDKENLLSHPNLFCESILRSNLLQTYGLDKPPKLLPCKKKCNNNPWCLVAISKESKSNAAQLTEQIRDMNQPIGLQNTANTCWINSALQALFHLHLFRNCINSIEGFQGEESLSSLDYLLQSMFVEMELHDKKALACSSGSVFEKLAIFVTKEVMQKDQDYEVLKCVSEFLENTIDNLLGNPRTGPQFSSIFRTTLYRIAKWKCSSCGKEHSRQLPPDTCYMMAAYVSADECPLDQCILDLQTETQTGVSLVCADGGCGALVKADRVVTPQILSLPSLLIIRNNSLVDREIKRRLHVVYPETLDLTAHACNREAAHYNLRAVIYHHGHWIKHFSAHVKMENGKWFNFNDENVNHLVSRPGNCHPLETHKDYFSVANVANKYKNRTRLRVSRGAFIWIYERCTLNKDKPLLQPPIAVLDYVLAKQKSKKSTDIHLLEKMKQERKDAFERLPLRDVKHEQITLISRPLLSSWLSSQDLKFIPQPSLLAQGMCEHRKFDPTKLDSFKCIIRTESENLVNSSCGIHLSDDIPLTYSFEDGLCLSCVSRHAHHIMFREHLKDMYKKAKKESSKEPKIDTTFIGTLTLNHWVRLALNVFIKEHGLEEEDGVSLVDDQDSETKQSVEEKITDSTEGKEEDRSNPNKEEMDDEELKAATEPCSETNGDDGTKEASSASLSFKENGSKGSPEEQSLTCFNEDIVCIHNMIDPKISGVWIPKETAKTMSQLCGAAVHPAVFLNDFDICKECKRDMDKTMETCSIGKTERRQLYQLLAERKRPHRIRDVGKTLFLLSRDFLSQWKSFVRSCVKDDKELCRPKCIQNSHLLCKHNQLLYKGDENSSLFEFAAVVWEDEWNILKNIYPFDASLEVTYDEKGNIFPQIGVCENQCVEEEAARLYEEQFNYEYEMINIKQVNSVDDVPCGSSSATTTVSLSSFNDNSEPTLAKIPRIAKENVKGVSSLRTASQRLVRASKTFSSSDTIKEIQNFIADRTGIWPLLQTLWLSGGKEHGPHPFVLTDKHRSMTLKALRIKPGDTVYFRAAMEDLEKAAGDGETEYNEIIMEDQCSSEL